MNAILTHNQFLFQGPPSAVPFNSSSASPKLNFVGRRIQGGQGLVTPIERGYMMPHGWMYDAVLCGVKAEFEIKHRFNELIEAELLASLSDGSLAPSG